MNGKNNPMFGKTGKLSPRYGVKHSEETKAIIREKRKTQQITEAMLLSLKNGRKDSSGTTPTDEVLIKMKAAQSGRMWVHNDTEKHRIKKEQAQKYLDLGFLLGKGKSPKYNHAAKRDSST